MGINVREQVDYSASCSKCSQEYIPYDALYWAEKEWLIKKLQDENWYVDSEYFILCPNCIAQAGREALENGGRLNLKEWMAEKWQQ